MNTDYWAAGDEALVRGCLAGEPAALEALIRRYQNAVFAVALFRLGRRADAEDVVQETFIAAVQRLHTLQEPSRVGSWLCGIARHKAQDWLARRPKSAALSWDSADATAAVAQGDADVADVIADAELRVAVRSAIGRLPPLQREAVILHYVGGYGLREAARLLGVPLGTVKRRLYDARQKLKGDLFTMTADELGRNAPSGELASRIQKAVAAAWSAYRGQLPQQALRHCEEARQLISGLPPGRARSELESQALTVKANVIRFPVGGRAAIEIHEQVLALLEALEDKRKVAQHLVLLGGAYSNDGDRKKADEAYQRALDLFTELGDEAGQGDALMWLGHQHLPSAPEEALSCFQRALPLLRRGPRRDSEAICRADIQALKGAAHACGTDRLKVYGALCEMLQASPDGVRFQGQPGFVIANLDRATEAPLGIDIVEAAGQGKVLVSEQWSAGDTWQAKAFSYSMYPLQLTGTVVTTDERVAVPAGTFDNCLCLRLAIVPDPSDDGPERSQRLNRLNCGEKCVWYCRGVGLVRFTFVRADGVRADIQLTDRRLARTSDEYLPLDVGNRWEYRVTGFDSYVQESVYEVLATEANRYYLTHWAYAYLPVGGQA